MMVHIRLWWLTNASVLCLNGIKFSQLKRLTVLLSGLSQTLRGIFVGPRSFSYFSAQGIEKGGEAEPTQKATLFPSGSALHPTMNGVLKNITLGTRLFFIPHNWAICPRVSSVLLVQSANETAVVLECCACCAGVKMPTPHLFAQWHPGGPLVFWDNATVQWKWTGPGWRLHCTQFLWLLLRLCVTNWR